MTKELPRVLLVLLDEEQCRPIESALREADYEVSVASEPRKALQRMNEENPLLVIVDSGLPDIGEIFLLKAIRSAMNLRETSIITLSEDRNGHGMTPDIGREVDADLLKPFAMAELMAMIDALQRQLPARRAQQVLTAGAIEMVPEQWLVYVNGEPVNLTEKEYRLLQELMEVRGRVLTRETLLERVWGHQKSFKLETRTLDVHMSRLRAKLGPSASSIITVRNVGYRMNLAPEWLNH